LSAAISAQTVSPGKPGADDPRSRAALGFWKRSNDRRSSLVIEDTVRGMRRSRCPGTPDQNRSDEAHRRAKGKARTDEAQLTALSWAFVEESDADTFDLPDRRCLRILISSRQRDLPQLRAHSTASMLRTNFPSFRNVWRSETFPRRHSGNSIAEILSSFLADASVEGLLQSLTAGCDPSLHSEVLRPVPLLSRPAVSTQVDDNLATLAEVRLSAGEPRLDELERGYGLARGPIP